MSILLVLGGTFAVLELSACAITPPKPTIWQIEGECADSQPISRIEECTRDNLDMQYGDAWHTTPAADQFLDFIGATAARVEARQMSDADGRLAILTYAGNRDVAIQEAQQRDRQRALQQALTAMLQAGPGSQGTAAFGRALSGTGGSTQDVSLYNGAGEAIAYIGDDMTIYLWGGQPVAYLDADGSAGYNVYGFNGEHLGWFANGAIWDHSGYAACAISQRLTVVAQIEPIKGIQQITPIKSLEQVAPIEPVLMNAFGDTSCESLLASGAS